MRAPSVVTEDRKLALLWGGVAAICAAAAPLAPRIARLLPPCLLKSLTGIPCPACGTTRGVLALLSGDVAGALRWNPLGTVSVVALVLGGFVAVALALAGRGVREPRSYPAWVRLAAIGVILGNWIWLLADGR